MHFEWVIGPSFFHSSSSQGSSSQAAVSRIFSQPTIVLLLQCSSCHNTSSSSCRSTTDGSTPLLLQRLFSMQVRRQQGLADLHPSSSIHPSFHVGRYGSRQRTSSSCFLAICSGSHLPSQATVSLIAYFKGGILIVSK
ncbi:hypothetical protein O6H91_15G034600 [Diphasiastrum complanatum]|uniref:Uncharacterized protein n=2 Tax=Diphasiastrum complanatum TaxID=34168 RepID=A0ACC2BI06_DIPCM|nr:hypothetical protein O6H91_15G032600 [Diphasiastrum complanatum]KAJ7529114.1 hypothetical protein O6H91_15G034600 [Diphasiastrum complanatum]